MDITVDKVREALRKDDIYGINEQIDMYLENGKASLYAVLAPKQGTYLPINPKYANEFENLSDSYLIEYCRAYIDRVDNDKILNTLISQLETYLI